METGWHHFVGNAPQFIIAIGKYAALAKFDVYILLTFNFILL